MKVALASGVASGSGDQGGGFVGATAELAVVLDGSAVQDDEVGSCVHGVSWFVRRLGVALIDVLTRNSTTALADNVAQAVVNVAALHSQCDWRHSRTPTAAVAILRERAEVVEFLVLGSPTILVEDDVSLSRVTHAGMTVSEATPAGPARAGGAGPDGRPASGATLDRHRRGAERTAGVGVDPEAAFDALTGRIPRSTVRRAALLSDGAGRLLNPAELTSWAPVLDLFDSGDPQGWLDRAVDATPTGADGTSPGRPEYADAAVASCTFAPPRGLG